jgi:hypothetical protein
MVILLTSIAIPAIATTVTSFSSALRLGDPPLPWNLCSVKDIEQGLSVEIRDREG